LTDVIAYNVEFFAELIKCEGVNDSQQSIVTISHSLTSWGPFRLSVKRRICSSK